ncbi:Protein CRABS CLAW [Hibiscus syriacus]|uniref:Protein CRABS CLAW n=1 Tax=Hibiscus syriacus TaxID=106335 RepID=A0A6A3ALB2_HIBSY|nr:Protein CRABS CLAW [Hibiscus syriacus]
MNLDSKPGMDLVPQPGHLCYVRCNFCNTVLAVGIPGKRLLETVTVKCGHCSQLSFLSTRPQLQGQCLDPQTTLTLQEMQSFCGDVRKNAKFLSSSSSTSS